MLNCMRSKFSNRKFECGALLILYLLTRMGTIIFFIDSLYSNGETYRVFVGREFFCGMSVPFTDYAFVSRGIGRLFLGIIAFPFLDILGNNYFTLKLFNIVIHFFIFLAWFKIISKYFSFNSAKMLAFLWIFSPTFFFNGDFVLDHHTIVLFFYAAITYFMLHYIENEKSRNRDIIFLSLVSGIAFIINPIFVVFFIYTILYLVLFFKIRLKQLFLVFICFLFSASYILVFSFNNKETFFNDGQNIFMVEHSMEQIIHRIIFSITKFFPNLFYFSNSGVFYFILIFLWVILYFRVFIACLQETDTVALRKNCYFVFFIPFMILLFSVNHAFYTVDVGYFYPLEVFIFVVFSINVWDKNKKIWRYMSFIICSLFLLLWGFSYMEKIQYYGILNGIRYENYENLFKFGRVLGGGEDERRKEYDLQTVLVIIKDKREIDKQKIISGYLSSSKGLANVQENFDKLPRSYHKLFWLYLRERIAIDIMDRDVEELYRRVIKVLSIDAGVFNKENILNILNFIKNSDLSTYEKDIIYSIFGILLEKDGIISHLNLSDDNIIASMYKGCGFARGMMLFDEKWCDIEYRKKIFLKNIMVSMMKEVKSMETKYKGAFLEGFTEGGNADILYELEDSTFLLPVNLKQYINELEENRYSVYLFKGLAKRLAINSVKLDSEHLFIIQEIIKNNIHSEHIRNLFADTFYKTMENNTIKNAR